MDESAVLEAIKVSGPAGGLVVILGFMIRGWLMRLQTAVDTLVTRFGKFETNVRERLVRLEVAAEKAKAVGE